jgi:hypothetical protein
MKVSHFRSWRISCAVALAGFLVLGSGRATVAQTNNWIGSGSGDWESPEWSLGLPAAGEDIFITNAGTKTIVIEPSTVQNYPHTLTVNSLTLSAPEGSANTLFLNYAGLVTPLRMQNLSVGGNSAVEMDGSALAVSNGLFLDGTFLENNSSVVTIRGVNYGPNPGGFNIGFDDAARYTLLGGSLSAYTEDVGVSYPSTFDQEAGTNTIAFLSLDFNGSLTVHEGSEYDLNGGEFDGMLQILASGTFKMAGGFYNASAMWIDGNFIQSGGMVTNAGSGGMNLPIPIFLGHTPGASGNALQTGGTNYQAGITLGSETPALNGDSGQNLATGNGNYTLSNGWLHTGSVSIWSNGTMEQSGGVNVISGPLSLQGSIYIASGYPDNIVINRSTSASYVLDNGFLSVSNLTLGVQGGFSQNGGTNIVAGDLNYTDVETYLGGNGGVLTAVSGVYSMGGGLLSVSNISGSGSYYMTGGQVLAQNVSCNFTQTGGTNQAVNVSGSYSLSGGLLSARNISGGFSESGGLVVASNFLVNGGNYFRHYNGTCSVPLVTLDNGTWQEWGSSARLGKLLLGAGTNSMIQIQLPAFSSSVQFADSSGVTWSNTGVLTIVNWNGSLAGHGTNIIVFGTNANGLTAQQLSQIQFANPVGLPLGYYLAKFLPSGEIVPGSPNYAETAPAPFFAGEAALGSGWFYLATSPQNVFGYYNLNNFPYIYHLDMGWEYFFDANNAAHGGYFYDFSDSTFFYTEPGLFPYVYDFKVNAWMYYAPKSGTSDHYTSNPRWFYNLSTKTWGNHL